jgi:hypothetical protein
MIVLALILIVISTLAKTPFPDLEGFGTDMDIRIEREVVATSQL